MTITEQFICGKHTADDCEDGIVITNDFAAVIDGSTSKTPTRLDPSMKNGRFAMLLISEYIKQMPANYTMYDFCRGITLRIAEEYNKRSIAERMAEHPEERLTASVIVYSNCRKEGWKCISATEGRLMRYRALFSPKMAIALMAPKWTGVSVIPRLTQLCVTTEMRNT